jgi:septum formation protein
MSNIWIDAFRLALASSSKSRRRLMEAAGLHFEVVVANVDERGVEARIGDVAPARLALELARAKALSAKAPGALIVGADQVLSLDDRVFHKSGTRAEAFSVLCQLSGRTHILDSAFAIVRDGEVLAADMDTARMSMRQMNSEALDLYLDFAGPEVLGAVGVYQWERLGVHLFESVEGDHSTILGLPMLKLIAALRDLGALRL